MFTGEWVDYKDQSHIRFKCGYCGVDTSPSKGWRSTNTNGIIGYVLICTSCNQPSFVIASGTNVTTTTPSPKLGNEVQGLPDEILHLYDEARSCSSIKAYTSVVLTCRKILMHIAVNKGASEGMSFIKYIDFLGENGFIPPDGREWIDHIRSKANEANHEIKIMDKVEAENLLVFTEMLLRLIYEFPSRLTQKIEEININ